MPSSDTMKRSLIRRTGEPAYGMLLLAKTVLMGAVTILLVFTGVWTSWDTAQPAMFGDKRGTVRGEKCGQDSCTARFTPSGGKKPQNVTIARTVSGKEGGGETLDVALRPGTKRVVRTGPAGILYAWVPLGGALLLASLVIAGGLRLRRTAVVTGLIGAVVMASAWALLTF